MEYEEYITNQVAKYFDVYGQKPVPVKFTTKKGGKAGTFYYTGYIEFNVHIIQMNSREEFEHVIAHETAHCIDYRACGDKQRLFKSGSRDMHGKYFKAIMLKLGFAGATARHDLKYKPARVYRQFKWDCKCKSHIVKTPRHNKMVASGKYQCIDCKTKVHFVKEMPREK